MIYLSLGSNLSSSFGDRFDNLEIAIDYLKKHDIEIIKRSSFYETPSYPDFKNPKFINIVILVQTDLLPQELMKVLLLIEHKLERKRDKKNDPRTLDIDIIDYKNQIFNFKYKNLNLEIPHKKACDRNFVLYPLEEINPNWKHPKTNEIIKTLIQKLSDNEKKSILKVKKH